MRGRHRPGYNRARCGEDLHLAQREYDVAFTYHSSTQDAQELVQQLQQLGAQALAIPADLTFLPAAVPKDILAQLYNEVAQALRAPDVAASLARQGATPGAMSQPQFADFVKSEHARWGKVARATGIRLD